MIFSPAIIALLGGSVLVCIFSAYAAVNGVAILRFWDRKSAGERQLLLEKKTYLISTIFSAVMVFEILSLFLFIYTGEKVHTLFTGAMCAAGSFMVNGYGYPALFLKAVTFILCGIWIIINYADNKAYDYPLIRYKYKLLVAVVLLIFLESYNQGRFFTALKADVVTSCCGTLFSEGNESIGSDLASLSVRPSMIIFFLSTILTIRIGINVFIRGRGAVALALFSGWSTVFQ